MKALGISTNSSKAERKADIEELSVALAFADLRTRVEEIVANLTIVAAKPMRKEFAGVDFEELPFGREVHFGEKDWISNFMKARANP